VLKLTASPLENLWKGMRGKAQRTFTVETDPSSSDSDLGTNARSPCVPPDYKTAAASGHGLSKHVGSLFPHSPNLTSNAMQVAIKLRMDCEPDIYIYIRVPCR
jgi:hypothetical protein